MPQSMSEAEFDLIRIFHEVSGILVDETIENQCRMALSNMKNIIDSSGSSVNDIVKTTIYLTDLSTFQSVNNIYKDFFQVNCNIETPLPARTTIGINSLPLNALIEIEAVVIISNV
jgi:2-iminobutanoate/2-iminopropanoate deaminase